MNQLEQFRKWRDSVAFPAESEIWQAAQAAAVPEGWQVVPKEPDGNMVTAGMCCALTIETYKAMLAVAPKPTEDGK